jgi:hypothetical protein
MKIAIVGNKLELDYDSIIIFIESCHQFSPVYDTIILYKKKGSLSTQIIEYCRKYNIKYVVESPDYIKYKLNAITNRNNKVIDNCDKYIIFFDGEDEQFLSDIDYCKEVERPCYIKYLNSTKGKETIPDAKLKLIED